jgi:precorrin-4 methylase
MVTAAQKGKIVVQLVAGDAKEYDVNHEQLALLRCYCLEYEVVYGVS